MPIEARAQDALASRFVAGRGKSEVVRDLRLLIGVLAAMIVGCYQQPVIPREKPLACTGRDGGPDCPRGLVCAAARFCSPPNCEGLEDCPLGLVCGGRSTCVLPPDAGAGADAAAPDVGGAPDAAAPDAAADTLLGGS